MRIVAPLSRKPVGRTGFVLVVARDLANPYAPGETVTDAQHRYTIVAVEAAEGPREVSLLVKPVS